MTLRNDVVQSLSDSKHDLVRTGRSLRSSIVVWGVVGAIGVPIIRRLAGVTIDEAAGLLVVYLGISMVVLKLTSAAMNLLLRSIDVSGEPDREAGPRVTTLAWVAVTGGLFAVAALVTSLSYWAVQELGLTWAASTAFLLFAVTGALALLLLAAVGVIIVGYLLRGEMREFISAVNRKGLQVATVALLLFVSHVSSNWTQGAVRHVPSSAKHA